ncbi:redoxin family protein [Dongia rigui]|uniref:Redoxin family protein n=1 Tax=Dongia rigui TaxID=940149 RepID=A0ABU5DWC7_9PROT|nr:redoxin family protein [Dongia rigui]MDY0871602.1 redoxin family protein [Dongia rigui]
MMKRRELKFVLGLAVVAAGAAIAVTLSDKPGSFSMSPAIARSEAAELSPPLNALLQTTTWLNAPPLTPQDLRGKVVLVNFWTYSCINCVRTLPYLRAWAEKYRAEGLVVVSIHTPEFAFEKVPDNVTRALHQLDVPYRVAQDNDFRLWHAFGNRGWPAFYFIGADGAVAHEQLGEGDYEASEARIQALLKEAGSLKVALPITPIAGSGAQAAPDLATLGSGETYIGYGQASGFASPESFASDRTRTYTLPDNPWVNEWGLGGDWLVGAEFATSSAPQSSIAYRFHARDLHLVMAPASPEKPIRFRVTLDGKAPGADHGADTDPQGWGTLDADRLYQLVRQSAEVTDRTFRIAFEEPGVRAYAFTFG